MDIHVEVSSIDAERVVNGEDSESSAEIRKRVVQARLKVINGNWRFVIV
jgi:predicted ATPase with chaperone activity